MMIYCHGKGECLLISCIKIHKKSTPEELCIVMLTREMLLGRSEAGVAASLL